MSTPEDDPELPPPLETDEEPNDLELPPPLEVFEPTKERFVDRTPYRFPTSRPTTPELREDYRRSARAKKKKKQRKRRLQRAAALFVLLTLPVAYVWYTSRPHRPPENVDDSLVTPVTEFQKLLEMGDPTQLIKYSEALDNDVLSGVLPTQVAALEKRDQIADRLLELRADEDSTHYGIATKINGLMTLTGFDILNDFDETISTRLLDFATEYEGSADPKIRNRANLGIVASRLHDYIQNNSEENFDQVKHSLAQLLNELEPDATINGELRMIVPIMALSKRDDHIREFKSMYGAKLKQSPDSELRAFGALVFDETIIGAVNFETLRESVLVPNPDAIAEIENVVDAIATNPSVSSPVFMCTLGVVENLRQIKEDDLEQQLIDKLRTAIPRIPDDATREQVAKGLSDYDTRRNLLGKIVDPQSRLTGQENLQPRPMATVIVFFSYTNSSSAKLISSLNTIDYLVQKKVPCLLVCVDASLATDEVEKIKAVFPSGKLIGPPDSVGYLARCPVLSVPYVLVLDHDQRVVGVNVSVDQIRGELEKLSKR